MTRATMTLREMRAGYEPMPADETVACDRCHHRRATWRNPAIAAVLDEPVSNTWMCDDCRDTWDGMVTDYLDLREGGDA